MGRTVVTPRDEEVLKKAETPKERQKLLTLFPSRQTGYRRLKRLEEAGLLHVVGFVRTNGRPSDILCTSKIKAGVHEIELGELLDELHERYGIGFEWGGRYQADATIGNLWIEYDRGTESMRQVESRLHEYVHADGQVLFVTTTPERAYATLDRSPLGERLYVTTNTSVRRGIAVDYRRKETALETVLKAAHRSTPAKDAIT